MKVIVTTEHKDPDGIRPFVGWFELRESEIIHHNNDVTVQACVYMSANSTLLMRKKVKNHAEKDRGKKVRFFKITIKQALSLTDLDNFMMALRGSIASYEVGTPMHGNLKDLQKMAETLLAEIEL